MDKVRFNLTGGYPLDLDDFQYMLGQLDGNNYGIFEAMQAQYLDYGNNFIVSGCVYTVGTQALTAGWIVLDGELMRVDSQTGTDVYFTKVDSDNPQGTETFENASTQQTYARIRGVLSADSGNLNITTASRLHELMVQQIATTTAQFNANNIPNLDAGKITSGAFATARIPSLDANKITSGSFATARIPNLDASKITSGTLAAARLPQATISAIGAARLTANEGEARAGTNNTSIMTPLRVSNVVGGFNTITIDLGTWNMNSVQQKVISHSLISSRIRRINILIRHDNSATDGILVLPQAHGTNGLIEGVSIASSSFIVQRDAAKVFGTQSAYSGTTVNRGWIVVSYNNA